MTVRVVRITTPPSGPTRAVIVTPVGSGARTLDELDDVAGATAGTTGQVLTRQSDGQYRPADPQLAASVDRIELAATAGETLSGHRAVTRDIDDTLIYASNDDLVFLNAPVWITTGAALTGAPVSAVAYGPLSEPSWSWTPGPVYLGVDGLLTQTPPSASEALFLAQVAVATSDTSVFVDRCPSIVLT